MNRLSWLDVWNMALKSLEEGRPCVLLVTAEIRGSGPGAPGSIMAVTPDSTAGTVGGGILEARLIQSAREGMADGKLEAGPVRHVHRESPGSIQEEAGEGLASIPSGMVCSGSQTTIILPLEKGMLRVLVKIAEMLRSGDSGILEISPEGLNLDEKGTGTEHSFSRTEGSWRYRGPVGTMDTVYIIGGGHVGMALARLLPGLSFKPVIIDSRDIHDRGIRKPPCQWIQCPFNSAHMHVREGPHTWAVVMTPEHESDGMVLRSLAQLELRYVGMMASRAKRAQVYSELKKRGVPKKFLDSVHCPIGLAIGSRTPDEIAISIAAELIGVRSCILA
jgi:xanthine dehydrogenase accessory factor